ncbi:uncharacterized protein C8Q71DRAFT_796689 [Rhodofomes roseus]|uniref:25S rRNA (uridine-N(3))-methyltransferase BMT5-like domain-containing protein n=1 Tax=Rhodofomes roseus TaxID=34475 RepID=A0ABQ8KHJ5_9APHY|nr:uncharacterized protein C8Q71DRAFT_796689 [Rhodofomes roseus]KAH9837335.1 hypothetical protein C8Q71DRAFT_796689 [Rhodofomes roseus]
MAKGKGKKTSLKASLSSQQSRLKKKQEAAHAEQIDKAKQSARAKGKAKALPPRPTIPFEPTDRILLIGEGNFSFARALVFDAPSALEFLPPGNVTATAYDSEDDCYSKYPDAPEVVATLRKKGVQVIFNVDATRLEKHTALKGTKWDKIVWNFPHAGRGITDQDRNIRSNQILIVCFLRSAAPFLATGPVPTIMQPRKRKADPDEEEDDAPENAEEGDASDLAVSPRGSILITLRNVPPYTQWDVPRLAKKPPPPASSSTQPVPRFVQLRSFVFHRALWKGYEHRMTKGERAHGEGKTGEGGEDRTWQFCLAE